MTISAIRFAIEECNVRPGYNFYVQCSAFDIGQFDNVRDAIRNMLCRDAISHFESEVSYEYDIVNEQDHRSMVFRFKNNSTITIATNGNPKYAFASFNSMMGARYTNSAIADEIEDVGTGMFMGVRLKPYTFINVPTDKLTHKDIVAPSQHDIRHLFDADI